MSSVYAAQRLAPTARKALLESIIDAARTRGAEGAPVVVFDLDGTLMDNRPRVVAILHELAEVWRDEYPEAAAACAKATLDDVVYEFIANLKKLGVHEPALHERGLYFWRERFFQDPHMRFDIAVPGAQAFAHACYDAGAVLVYMTGRDLPNMALGTLASLRDLGFPIGVIGTELVVKPAFEIPDTEFKSGILRDLTRLGRVIAAFDNESANVNLFLEAFPECASVLLDTQHAPNPPALDPRGHVIETFEMP